MLATLIYKNYARKKYDRKYIQWANKFEDLAVQILEKLYEVNSQACLKAIVRQVASYGDTKWLDLAVAANATEFIVYRAVQNLFNDIWFVINKYLMKKFQKKTKLIFLIDLAILKNLYHMEKSFFLHLCYVIVVFFLIMKIWLQKMIIEH